MHARSLAKRIENRSVTCLHSRIRWSNAKSHCLNKKNVAFNTIWLMNFNSLVSIDDST